MKKYGVIATILLLSCAIFFLGFNYKNLSEPETYYQVYLDDEVIGTIHSKDEMEEYIDKEGEQLKRKYKINKVYAPNGLQIKKITTYNKKIDTVKEVYQKIKNKRPFTIKGYQVTIRQMVDSEEEEDKTEEKVTQYYVLKEKIFRDAVENMIQIFVGKDRYETYKNKEQKAIETTGTILTDVYIDGDKTIKEMQIPVTKDIYTDSTTLAHDLIFGKNSVTKKYIVQVGDTIEKVAFNNQISVEEFLISNPEFTSANNLLYPKQEVVIGLTNPQLSVVTQEFVVQDKESDFASKVEYDDTMLQGDEVVKQAGEKGLERISQKVKSVNGVINYVERTGKEVIKSSVDQIIVKGSHYVPDVGTLTGWAWPTESGWTITSYYAWRISPITRRRELHDALDIAGTGYGSPIYAANNGTVAVSSYTNINGNYIIINHNNGYYSYYGHMSRRIAKKGQTVAKGQEIGKVGMTGWATGPHVHFGIWRGFPYYGGVALNPLNFY